MMCNECKNDKTVNKIEIEEKSEMKEIERNYKKIFCEFSVWMCVLCKWYCCRRVNNENENVLVQTMRHYYCCCLWEKLILFDANCEIQFYRSITHTHSTQHTHPLFHPFALSRLPINQKLPFSRDLNILSMFSSKETNGLWYGRCQVDILMVNESSVIAKLLADFRITWIIRP